MKSLVIYGSYGCRAILADVEKETDENNLKGFIEPEKVFKEIKRYIACDYTDLKIKKILGEESNYLLDNIGYIPGISESYVIPITEQQFEDLFNSVNEKINDTINYFKRRILEYKSSDLITRNEILNEITSSISKLDIDSMKVVSDIFSQTLKEIEEEVYSKAKETGEKQVLSRRNVRCNNRNKECNLDVITEYITPSGECIEERQHTY